MPNDRPLTDTEYRLLACLPRSREEIAGREVALQHKELFGHRVSYGTVYPTLTSMRDRGLLEMREELEGDGRVRHYRITGAGERAWEETRRWYEGRSALPVRLLGEMS